jgi:hypothetical protein
MIVTFSIKTLMKDIPPTLWSRRGQAIFDSARTDYHIVNSAAKSLDGADWSSMPIDVRSSTPSAVYDYLQLLGAASVRLQEYDCDLYLAGETDPVRELVKLNWGHLYGNQELEPDEVVSTFRKMVMAVLTHRPAEQANAPDPFYRPEHDAKERAINDAVWLEMQEQEAAAQQESQRRANQKDADGFYDSF